MPDPREFTPDGLHAQLATQERNGHLSPLMRAHMQAVKTQEKPNFCPYGCTNEDLDENGYCDHLVGFTNDGKFYEPFTIDKRKSKKGVPSRTYGRKIVMVKLTGPKNKPVPVLMPVEKTDKLVTITCSKRVYRDVPVEKRQVEVHGDANFDDFDEPADEPTEPTPVKRGRNKKTELVTP